MFEGAEEGVWEERDWRRCMCACGVRCRSAAVAVFSWQPLTPGGHARVSCAPLRCSCLGVCGHLAWSPVMCVCVCVLAGLLARPNFSADWVIRSSEVVYNARKPIGAGGFAQVR